MARVTTGEPAAAESGGRPAAVVAGQPRDPRLRRRSPAGSCCRWRATRSPGPRTCVFPGLGRGERLVRRARVPERAPILARDGTPLAEGPAASRSSPLGAARPERRRRGRIAHAPSRTASSRGSGSRRARRPGPAASSSPSTGASPDGRAAQLVAVAGDGRAPSGGPVLAEQQARPGQAGAHDDRPRPPAGGGGGARRPVRRRRRAGRSRRLGAGAGRDRLLRASAAGLDLQGHHDHRRARGGRRRAHGPVPGPDLDRGRRPRDRQRPQRGLRRQLRRGLRALVQQRLRAARPRARLGAPGRGGRALRLQLAPEPVRRGAPFGPWTRPRARSPPRSRTTSSSG